MIKSPAPSTRFNACVSSGNSSDMGFRRNNWFMMIRDPRSGVRDPISADPVPDLSCSSAFSRAHPCRLRSGPDHGSRTMDREARIPDHGSPTADVFAHERWEAYLRANAESSGTACGRTASETIDGIARRENESFVGIKREPDQRTARQHLLRVGGTVNRNPVQPACPRDGINHIEVAMRIEREPLGPAESLVEHFDGA